MKLRAAVAVWMMCVVSLAFVNSPAVAAAGPNGVAISLRPCRWQGTANRRPGLLRADHARGTKSPASRADHESRRRHGPYLVGLPLNLPEQKRKQVGAWIALSVTRVHVHPQHAAVVSVVLHVPTGTPAGQYVGGVTAFVPSRRSHSTSLGANRDGSILLQLRRVVAVEVTVPGSSLSRFKISRVNPKRRPDAVYLIAHIRNAGTLLLKGQGHLWVWQQGRRKPVVSANLTVDTTVPRTTVLYLVFWSTHPMPGSYRYSIAVSWAGGHVQHSGQFVWTR